jgi:hypothetical protein
MNNTTRYAYWFDSTTYLVMLTKSYANTEVIVLILIFLLLLFCLCMIFTCVGVETNLTEVGLKLPNIHFHILNNANISLQIKCN